MCMRTFPRFIGTSLIVSALLFAPALASAAAKKPAKSSSAATCTIKGNISTSKGHEKIYHLPGCTSYNATVITTSAGERWFCTEKQAKDAGWRKALNCPK